MWNSVSQVICALMEEEYVILRNAEKIGEDFEEKDDWDILCSDIQRLTKRLAAVPLNNKADCFNYYIVVNGKKLLLDIRCIGDGYYDNKWEEEMLNTRRNIGSLYVLNDEQQKYSLLYHCLIHKDNLSVEKYKNVIEKYFDNYDVDNNMQLLARYMDIKKYCFALPKDEGVYLNTENINQLQEMLNGRKN